MIDWVLRFFKGAVIGMDFVLPGISGAALAVVFGLYEKIVTFIANIRKDFIKNLLFFLPVGLGALSGIYLVSHPISFLKDNYQTPFLWFFAGAILGTMPELWSKSGEKGRKPMHIIIMICTFIFAAFFLLFSGSWAFGELKLNPLTSFISGGIVAFIALIPGFSSSNFLVLFGLYGQMIDAYRSLNFAVLLPFVLGMGAFVIPFSKLIEFLLKKLFTGFFHVIIGFVLASAILIAAIASGWQQEGGYYNYLQTGAIACVVTFIAGGAFSFWMCKVSGKYSR
ncbi:MAG: DUF368 domain-containing protein [Treponema sp.]|nr:DUF368 domain-containing protein [Treponema sp.]